MIDYEKLIIAIDLADKGCPDFPHTIGITIYTCKQDCSFLLEWRGNSVEIPCVDELIAKLQEITKPKHKYAIGQEVWVNSSKQIPFSCYVIKQYDCSDFEYVLYIQNADEEFCMKERFIYPSREDLIRSQIEYWKELLVDEKLGGVE
jgi:hypothetical protein